MKVLKRILLVLLLMILILTGVIHFYTQGLKPQYEGNLQLEGLKEEVEVYFDDYGIPHIYAQNQEDLYLAFGYLHAQERLWQMDLLRRIAPGRLSEFFGSEMIAIDKLFRTLSIDEYSEKMANQLKADQNSPVLKASDQYLKGINQFIETGYTPIEYTLAGVEKTRFELKDIYNVIGYMSFSFAHAHKLDPWATTMLDKLGPEYINDLDLNIDPTTTLIRNYPNAEAYIALNQQTNKLLEDLPLPKWLGSNSWVVSPQNTATGSVLFANDPHIDYASPSVWYEAHLKSPAMEVYGYFVAGLPFGLLIHNQNIAMGLTMFENDDTDFYREQIVSPGSDQYLHKNDTLIFTNRSESIVVKDEETITMQVRSSIHGPIINDVIDGLENAPPTSMWWALTAIDNSMLDVAYQFNMAQNIDDVRTASANIHAAGLNVMYGDKEGNVAWWASAKLPKRLSHVNSKFILNGDGSDDFEGYLNFSQNPQAENPPWGYVYSANNQPDTIDNGLYPGYYLPEDRGRRIVELLEDKNDVDVNYMEAMLNDDINPASRDIKRILIDNITTNSKEEEKLLGVLKNWTGEHKLDNKGPAVYQALVYRVMKMALEDEMEEDGLMAFMTTNAYKRTIAYLIKNDSSIWWDNVTTSEIEDRTTIINAAFKATLEHLINKFGTAYQNNITWGNLHTLEHEHPFGAIEMLRSYFNVGPFNAPGGSEALNNMGFILDGDSEYPTNHGPSTRRIVDFSDIDNSRSILPTGNSGNIFSQHYQDQAKMYVNGEFRPMLLTREKVEKLKRKLILNK